MGLLPRCNQGHIGGKTNAEPATQSISLSANSVLPASLSSRYTKNAKNLANKLFNQSEGLVEKALLETEQYATKKTDFKLRAKKLTLT